MKPLVLFVSWGLTLASLGGLYAEHRRVTQLESRVTAVRNSSRVAADTADEVAGLTARVGRLERIVSFRAPQPGPVAAAPDAPAAPATPPAAVQQLREDVDALLTGEAISTEQGKARLRAIIAENQQQQWADRQVRRDERILQQLTDVAHLNTRQREDLGKALEAERNQRRELMNNARTSGNFQDMRPALQALRAQTDQKAKEILDAEQLNQYNTSRAPGGRGNRGGGGGEGGGPAQ